MDANRIVKFDPWLLGAIQKAIGNLPAVQGDLAKVKSLTFFDGVRFSGKEMLLLNKWIELASGDFSAIGKMPNLHTLLFKNDRILRIGNWDFLRQCGKLKKLDLSGTDFSDCELLAELPNLQYAMLPDRRQLIHTEVLECIQARTETEPEMNERSRAQACIDIAARERAKAHQDTAAREGAKACNDAAGKVENVIPGMRSQMYTGIYTADSRLICWIMVSLGKMPRTPNELAKVKILDSRKRNPSMCKVALGNLAENLPPWLIEKEGDFSLIGKLPNLQALLLWGVILDDFSFLSECKELLYVNLWDTNFTDCSLLVKLPYIEHIYLPEEGRLVNFSMLVEYRRFRLQAERQQRESFLHGVKSNEMSEAEQAQIVQALGRPSVFRIECQKAFGQNAGLVKHNARQILPEVTQKSALTSQTVMEGTSDISLRVGMESRSNMPLEADVEGRSDMPLEAGVESRSNMPLEAGAEGRSDMPQESGVKEVYGSSAKKEENEAIYREGEFDDLITVRGEDVVILYEGASQVRHVEAEFWMDQTPDLWKIFDQMRDEEDNWAKLASGKAEQLTDELMEAIRRGDVKTLYISLEPWGEGHNFIVEFADEWVEITYMDDETPVYYNSYNPAYSNPADLSPIEFGGQSPIPKMLALEDMELAEEIVRHILATGQLLPGTLWKTGEVC